ncbi:hypothetical protein OF83DRAFT_1133046 [Amylostereum chailletii]|nr:hypothetical protein OF83DRAFT_1133046 [Amylostereum chailletii]
MSSSEGEYSSDFEDDYSSSEEYDSDENNQDGVKRSEGGHPQGSTVEGQIEGDFNRLVQNIRIGDTTSTASLLNKEWDFNLDEQDAEFRNDLRAASGVGRKRGRKGRQAGPQLSQQVKALVGEGNQAYVDNDLQECMRIMQEVIRIEPRAASAWSVLANCYVDLEQPEKALQLRIMAAHLHHDAEEWEHLARDSREKGFNQQALYCFGKVVSLNPENVSALWDRASLAKELGEHRIARNSLLGILKRIPHDLTVLEEIRPILIELSDFALCAELFHKSFDHYASSFPLGHGLDPNTGAEIPGGGFGLMELLVLADLYNSMGEHDKAVHVIRSGCRWLQGRKEQKFWDACEDDREFDEKDWRAQAVGKERELPPGLYPLDVNARHRLAVARIRMRETEEGQMHANIVLSQDVVDYAPLFAEIADAYFERELYAEAKPIYELLGRDAGTSSLEVLIQVARCCHMLGDLEDAAEVYESVVAADPSSNDTKMLLAEIYEVLGEPRKALELVYQVIDTRRRRPRELAGASQSLEHTTTSLFEETSKAKGKGKAQNRLTPAQLLELEKQREKEVMTGYRRVRELWPLMMESVGVVGQAEAEREWMLEAEKLVETFRVTRNLFTTSKAGFRGMFPTRRTFPDPRPRRQTAAEENEDDMASRLHLNLEHDRVAQRTRKETGQSEEVTVFRGVSFDDWLRLFMQYAFLLTKRGQYDLAEEVLLHLLASKASKGEKQDTIRLALIACAAHVKKHPMILEQCRKFIIGNQFNNEPLRLLTASLASGFRATDTFIVSTLQKALFREIKMSDTAINNKDKLKWNAGGRRWAIPLDKGKSKDPEDADEDGDYGPMEDAGVPNLPTKNNPVLVTLYGQLSLGAKSYQSAIFYLLHAYDYCPEDPMICLCLAIASMGRAMQRQADNRHHLITQAMAFLTKYRELRKPDSVCQDEIEFNFGRAFQQLSLHSLAVKHYELVLQMAEERTKLNPDDIGLAKEAAYNLSLIYVTTGATPLAAKLYRRWLTL